MNDFSPKKEIGRNTGPKELRYGFRLEGMFHSKTLSRSDILDILMVVETHSSVDDFNGILEYMSTKKA
jgi:hypothetical protein